MSEPTTKPIRRYVVWTTGLLVLGVLIYLVAAQLQVFREGFHAVFAIFLGVSLTIALAVGLMALTFHSNRSGHDDEIDP